MLDELSGFSIVEQAIERRLNALGLSPRRTGEHIDTGYDKLEIHRSLTEVLSFKMKDNPANPTGPEVFFASSEILATLRHPSLGSFEISDQINSQGDSPANVLGQCANTYMDVTFPALQSLFEKNPVVGASQMKMATLTLPSEDPIGWDVFTGQLQILNDDDRWLQDHLNQPLLTLVRSTLMNYLRHPRLHWCKLYGRFYTANEVEFGCAIDGKKEPNAEAELRHKFGNPGAVPRRWEFRQFIVLSPIGQVDEKTFAKLRQNAAEQGAPSQPNNSSEIYFSGF